MTIPLYPEFKPVGLEDREVIMSYLDAHPTGVCAIEALLTLLSSTSKMDPPVPKVLSIR